MSFSGCIQCFNTVDNNKYKLLFSFQNVFSQISHHIWGGFLNLFKWSHSAKNKQNTNKLILKFYFKMFIELKTNFVSIYYEIQDFDKYVITFKFNINLGDLNSLF